MREQKDLEKKYGKKKAKEMTQAKLKEIMNRLETEEKEKDMKLRENKNRYYCSRFILVFLHISLQFKRSRKKEK